MPSPVPDQDLSMHDEQQAAEDTQHGMFTGDRSRITVLPGATDTAASFQFADEGHTLGNALRYVIMKNPLVEFCGYTIPHPSEPKMNLRIQTYENTTALEALEKGLDDLMDLCEVVTEKFTNARDEFHASQETHMRT